MGIVFAAVFLGFSATQAPIALTAILTHIAFAVAFEVSQSLFNTKSMGIEYCFAII